KAEKQSLGSCGVEGGGFSLPDLFPWWNSLSLNRSSVFRVLWQDGIPFMVYGYVM
ncbi:hypothetical protein AVEN_136593-1, partial [Araneus ventricosus]